MEAGKAALEWLEAERKLLVKGRELALAQRKLLYAADELAMASMRLRLRLPGESVRAHEVHFKLHEAEVPVKNKVGRCLRLAPFRCNLDVYVCCPETL